MSEGLVYIGKVLKIDPIPNADRVSLATVVCGEGGKWKGVVKKGDFEEGSMCLVYLPDSVVPQSEEMKFLESSNWRVKMRCFRGCPSEVVIMPPKGLGSVGTDMTGAMGVTKFFKPIPANLAGEMEGDFPSFIPKTDEFNYQKHQNLVEALTGQQWYMTEKCDGSSTTAYKYKGHFGVCSRNLELKETEHNGYWKVANEWNLREKLPEGIALQWETCGPGIQKNPMGLDKITGFVFSAFDIENQQYLAFYELTDLCTELKAGRAELLNIGVDFDLSHEQISQEAKGLYSNGAQREGVVFRSVHRAERASLISFKSINILYENG